MSGKKILVADDSLTIQKVIRLALSGDGYQIQTVSDGKEALEQASLFRPDICIIDVSLPQYDAYQIREHFLSKPDLKNIPIILMSSAFEKVDEPRMQTLGFSGHLIKPFDPSHLRSTLLSVADHTSPNDPIEASVNEHSLKEPSIHFDPPPSSRSPSLSIEPTLTNFNLTQPNLKSSPQTFQDDMRLLTENTFELSGLDQQEWGVVEPVKEVHLDTQTADFNNKIEPEYTKTAQNKNSSSSYQYQDPFIEQAYTSSAFAPPPVSTDSSDFGSPNVENLIKIEVAKLMSQMHTQLQERIEAEVRNYASQRIPEMAEKVIKEEIHRLLSEPPN